MRDPQVPLTPPRHELIDFHGDQLIAVVLQGDGVAIPLRLLCERIGLDTDAQAENLRPHAVLAAGLRVVNVEMNGRIRSVMAIIHTMLPFWLATISPEQVNDALPIDTYDAAVAWIERKVAELLLDDPDAVAPRQEAFL